MARKLSSSVNRLIYGLVAWFNDRIYIDIIQIYDLPAVLCRMKFTFELTSGSIMPIFNLLIFLDAILSMILA